MNLVSLKIGPVSEILTKNLEMVHVAAKFIPNGWQHN